MRKNCQLYHAMDLWDEIFNYAKYEPANVHINDKGDLVWFMPDESGHDKENFMVANECAYSINMPLFELVMVEEDGEDVYGLLFYEEN